MTITLKGWTCICGIFNGEEKSPRETCRTCDRARPAQPTRSSHPVITRALLEQLECLRDADDAFEMYELTPRLLIVTDGFKWYVRHVRASVRDMARDEIVYRCDQPLSPAATTGVTLGGGFDSIMEAAWFVQACYLALEAAR